MTLEKLIPASFLFALALLIGISAAAYRSTAGLLGNTRWVQHSLAVRDALGAALASVKDAETGQRGYLLTGDERFLEPYYTAAPSIAQRIDYLRQLTVDNPDQQRRLRDVEWLATSRLNVLRNNLETRRQGAALGVSTASLEEGRRLMVELRQRIAEMDGEERRLQDERETLLTAAAQRTLLVIPLGGVLAVGVTTLAYLVIRRELQRRHQAEAKTLAFTRELERSNRELQDFAYVASHDLQEPLRKIQAFGDLLRSGHSRELSEEARDFVQRMQSAARRMQVLINDLLTFSRVTTKGQPFTPVNLNEVAGEVLGDLEVRLQQSGGRVEVGPLPTVEADATQMRQVLQNLIGNALKFRRRDAPPRVGVQSELVAQPGEAAGPGAGEFCRITVEDNGIGFDEKYLDRIFTPFQRLHARGEYEGTGMGLAVCRRIAERHGGSITAHSTPGRGSVFSITLPLKQKGERRDETSR